MDFRQQYENLLQVLCNAYSKMYRLLEGIEHCDQELARLSMINRPDVDDVLDVNAHKGQLLSTLDQISIAIEPVHEQLDGFAELCQEVSIHPMYRRMEDLQFVIYYYIRRVINKEDINNPDIIRRLNTYKESLELDQAISNVPESEKRIFMLVPEKNN